MTKTVRYGAYTITEEQLAEVQKHHEYKTMLRNERQKKLDAFVMDLDYEYEPLFERIESEIDAILEEGTPPNERLQES